MKLSDEGKKLIKDFEGLRLKTYTCVGGKLTVGYGHTGEDVVEDMEISAQRADELFDSDIQKFEKGVERLLKVEVSQSRFDSLVSFAFNFGVSRFAGSTLLKRLNTGDDEGASAEFSKWRFADGKEQPGLVRRRAAERELFDRV